MGHYLAILVFLAVTQNADLFIRADLLDVPFYDDVAELLIQFDGIADAVGLLTGNERRTGAAEGVEHHGVCHRAVLNGIGKQRNQEQRYQFRREVRAFVKWYNYISQITRMFDKELHKEYILCSYLAKLLPSDKTQPFDLDNRVKLEYYRLEKTYEGAIELEATPGSWKPTQPKRAGGQKDRLSPLDEIIARINEEFFGDFTDADRVMVDTLYTKMRQDAKVKKAAKSNDRQVYERSIFPGIFDTTAQQAYMENTEAYEQLFLDAEKYRIIQQALAERLYRELHGDSK